MKVIAFVGRNDLPPADNLPLKMRLNGEWVVIGTANLFSDGSLLCDITDEDARLKMAFDINGISIETNLNEETKDG